MIHKHYEDNKQPDQFFTEDEWLAGKTLVRSEHSFSLATISAGRKVADSYLPEMGIFDHGRLYKTTHATHRYVGVSHVYGLTENKLQEIVDAVEKYNVTVDVGVSHDAWYGHSTSPILWLPAGCDRGLLFHSKQTD